MSRQQVAAVTPGTPATPLAGLKLLSRLASPHLRDLEQERRALALHDRLQQRRGVGGSPASDEEEREAESETAAEEEEEEELMESEEDAPRARLATKRKASPPARPPPASRTASASKGRKDKSLGLISEKFLTMYEEEGEQEISLDIAAQCLGVERRRIYDIVNVLEGLEVVVRKGKNTYTWFGLERLEVTLAKLKALVPTHLDSPQKSGGSSRETRLPAKGSPRKERSLGVLAQRFIMLFLERRAGIVALDDAADRLIFGNCPEAQRTKSKRSLCFCVEAYSLLTSHKTTHTRQTTSARLLQPRCDGCTTSQTSS